MTTTSVKSPRNEKYKNFPLVIETVREYFIFCNVEAGTRYMVARFVWRKNVDASLVQISAALQILKKNAEITFEKGVWFAIAIR